ncbi:hypothetical protein BGX24_006576 [Mortierella sp. AD032]|nr:hypothetical protein BGX24_006576 [Mortierella sp. AD032]
MRETSLYPVPEGSHEQQTNHIHIDMTTLDTLMPIAVSDEIKPAIQPQQQEKVVQDASKSLACIQPATTVTAAATATTEHKPRASTDTIMPTPVLRRPKLTVRRSTDSFIQGGRARISMCLPPPPPPPTIPPPAIPIINPGDSGYGGGRGRVSTESSSCQSSIYSTHPTAGRRTRSSTESSRVAYSRRSVSMDASSAGDGRRLSRRVILPPTIPPPPVPLPPPPPIPVPVPTPSPTSSVPSTPTNVQQFQPQQHVAPPPRRRHQRNPSQILNTSLFDSSDRSAISPPLSPLTIQIPRPSSRSFQSLLTINTQLTAENVQQYLQQQQPAPLEIAKPDSPTDSVAAPSPRTTSLYHSPRSRRKSTSQIETHRIMIPPSAANMTSPTSSTFSPPVPPLPPVPAMPTLFESYLPSSPSSTTSSSQSCISMKRPSLSHQMSSSSLDSTRTDNTASTSVNARIDIHHYHHHYHDNNDNGADDSHRYQYHHNYHDGRHSAEPKKRQQQKQQRRRSMSLPSSPCSPSSSNQVESKEDFASAISGTSNTTTAIATKDQELQAIIADAIAIAAAKTAAIESARQNTFHRQMQVKYQKHQQQQQRRLYPSQMDPWRSTTPSPSTLDSSRPESPL